MSKAAESLFNRFSLYTAIVSLKIANSFSLKLLISMSNVSNELMLFAKFLVLSSLSSDTLLQCLYSGSKSCLFNMS
jgi:hypothetical protein